MPEEREAYIVAGITVDKRSFQQASRAWQNAKDEMQSVNQEAVASQRAFSENSTSIDDARQTLDRFADSQAKARDASNRGTKAMSEADAMMDDLRKTFLAQADALDDAADSARNYDAALEGAGQTAEDFPAATAPGGAGATGDGDGLDTGARVSRGRQVASGLSAFGGGDLQRIAMAGLDLADASVAAGELGMSLPTSTSGMVALGAASAAAAVAVVAIVVVLEQWGAESARAAELERQRIEAMREANAALAAGATAEEQRLVALRSAIDVQAAETDVARLEQRLRNQVQALRDAGVTVLGIIDPMTDKIGDLEQAVSTFAFGGGEAGEILRQLTVARTARTHAANINLEASRSLLDPLIAQSEALADARREAELAQIAWDALATGTAEGVQATVDVNQRYLDRLKLERIALEAIDEPGAAVALRLEEIAQEANDLREVSEALLPVLSDLTAEEAARLEVEERAEAAEEMRRERTELSEQAALDALEVQEELQESFLEDSLAAREHAEEIIAIREEEAEAETAIVQEAAKARADTEKKLYDSIIKATEKAADAATKTLDGLKQDQANLFQEFGREGAQAAIELQRDGVEANIAAQQEEAKSLRGHLTNLKRIRGDAELQEAELIQGRQFRALFNLRRQTRRRVDSESTAFTDQRKERLIALQQEREDLYKHYVQQGQDRVVALEQDRKDARADAKQRLAEIDTQKKAEIIQLRKGANDAVSVINNGEREKLRQLSQSTIEQLRIVNAGERERLLIMGQSQEAMINMLHQISQATVQAKGLAKSGSGARALTGSRALSRKDAPNRTQSYSVTNNIKGGADSRTIAQAVNKQTVRALQYVMGRG